MVQQRQPSRLTRTQLLKQLKDIGINVPSGMSTATLRQLAAHNDQAPPTFAGINVNAANDDSARSYPDFALESDPHLRNAAAALDSLPAVKTAPHTYSLFNCEGEDELDINVRRDPKLAIISLVHGYFIHSRANVST